MPTFQEQLEQSLLITPQDIPVDEPTSESEAETLHLTPPPAPQALQARKPTAMHKEAPEPTRKKRSDAGVPKKPPARAMAGDLFDIDTVEGRTFMVGTIRFWMSIGASPQVEALIAHLFRELDRRTQKSA